MRLDVTVGISIRETFSRTIASLESVLANTPDDVSIIFISSGLPDSILRDVRSLGNTHDIKIIHEDCYLSPNQARNLIIREATTKYIAFIDNDVELGENWLEPLVRCAEEEGADIVSPLIFERFPFWKYVHIAGGEAHIKEPGNGIRVCHELHRYSRQDIDTVPETLERCPTELFEFHVVLIDRAFLLEIGMLDEALLSVSEHWDVSVLAQELGRKIYFEPASRACYLPPFKPTEDDIRLFNLRWCDDWVNGSISRLEEKYSLTPDQGNLKAVRGYVKTHRLHKYVKTRRFLASIFGAKAASVFLNRIVVRIDPAVVNRAIRKDLAKWQAYTLEKEKNDNLEHIPDQRAIDDSIARAGHAEERAGRAQ